jgi:hypothetical protein
MQDVIICKVSVHGGSRIQLSLFIPVSESFLYRRTESSTILDFAVGSSSWKASRKLDKIELKERNRLGGKTLRYVVTLFQEQAGKSSMAEYTSSRE